MPEQATSGAPAGRWLTSLVVAALITLCWTGVLDATARDTTQATLTRALATYALARGLNGVISVAQGTEIAIQPVGVGLTVTPGEILDPLNDLVERFSWLVLLACASLGTQLLLTELLANVWVSALLTGALLTYLAAVWWPRPFPGRANLLRLCTALVFARFLFAAVTLVSGWVDQALLADRQAAAVAEITDTRDELESLERLEHAPPGSLLERLEAFVDEQRRALDVAAHLDALKTRVERAVGELINLMVVFVVQTLLLPIAGLALAWAACRWFWRRAAA